MHMEFIAKLYKKQIDACRLFLHEQPAHARSWALPCIRNIISESGLEVAEADQCMYGLKTWGKTRSCLVLAKKPRRFMTNSKALGRELSRKCDGQHEHQLFFNGRAKDAARYPPALCRAISRGIARENMERTCNVAAIMTMIEGPHVKGIDAEDLHERDVVDIPALIRKLEAGEERRSEITGPLDGGALVVLGRHPTESRRRPVALRNIKTKPAKSPQSWPGMI